MKNEETWLGIGGKIGGMLLIWGYESVSGQCFNLDNFSNNHTFSIKNHRLGLGLGGGTNFAIVCIFKTRNIYELDGKSVEDWGVNIDAGIAKLKHAAKLTKYNEFLQTVKLFSSLGLASVDRIQKLREGMSFFYNTFDVAASSGPAIHTIEIPFAGIGSEISAFKTFGEISIHN